MRSGSPSRVFSIIQMTGEFSEPEVLTTGRSAFSG